MKLKTEAAKQLFKAASFIDTPERWCKAAALRGEARCAIGAMQAAGVTTAAAWSFLQLSLGASYISTVNDHPDTTHDDILMAFAMAITLAEDEA